MARGVLTWHLGWEAGTPDSQSVSSQAQGSLGAGGVSPGGSGSSGQCSGRPAAGVARLMRPGPRSGMVPLPPYSLRHMATEPTLILPRGGGRGPGHLFHLQPTTLPHPGRLGFSLWTISVVIIFSVCLLNPPACPEALSSLVRGVVWEYVSF